MLVVTVFVNGKGLGLVGNILFSTTSHKPTLCVFGVSLLLQALFRTPTRSASSIVVMLVATFAPLWPIALSQRQQGCFSR